MAGEEDTVTDVIATVRARKSTRRSAWIVLLVSVWVVLAVIDIAVLHTNAGSGRLASTAAAKAELTAPRARPSPSLPSASSAAPVVVQQLLPVRATAFGPAGADSGDHATSADLAIDASPSTAWQTDWYKTAKFGYIQSGTGLLIDMGSTTAIIDEADITLGAERGAAFELLTGNTPGLTTMRVQAISDDAGGMIDLELASPGPARYLLIWFTSLPRDVTGTPGTYRAYVYNVRLSGSS